jgi:site-specific DNA-cytosine methylase
MTRQYRAVELFGGEGISALGWAQAGFDVTLVENDPARIANAVKHPNIHVVEGDATTYPLDGFDVVTGGPPCTDHSETAGLAEKTRGGKAGTAWMLPHTLNRVREWAEATGGLWVIENVEGAKEHCSGIGGSSRTRRFSLLTSAGTRDGGSSAFTGIWPSTTVPAVASGGRAETCAPGSSGPGA